MNMKSSRRGSITIEGEPVAIRNISATRKSKTVGN